MIDIAQKSWHPKAALAAVTSAGGPTKVFSNAKSTLEQMVRDLRGELKISTNHMLSKNF
jgi:hypothetical protein